LINCLSIIYGENMAIQGVLASLNETLRSDNMSKSRLQNARSQASDALHLIQEVTTSLGELTPV
jgi:hypothetical protein